MISKKASENAEQTRPQIEDDTAPATYYRAFKDIAAWMPKNSILSAEGAGTMGIGLTEVSNRPALIVRLSGRSRSCYK